MNRVLPSLRGQGPIALDGKDVVLLAPDGLMASGGFDPNHLHLGRESNRAEPGGTAAGAS